MVENGKMGFKNEKNNEEFHKILEFLSGLIQSLHSDVKSNNESVSVLKTEVKHLLKNFDNLSDNIKQNQKDVTDIFFKVSKLEDGAEDQQKEFFSLNEKFKKQEEKQEKQKEKQEEKEEIQRNSIAVSESTGKWQMRTSMIVAIISLIGTLAGLIFNYFK